MNDFASEHVHDGDTWVAEVVPIDPDSTTGYTTGPYGFAEWLGAAHHLVIEADRVIDEEADDRPGAVVHQLYTLTVDLGSIIEGGAAVDGYYQPFEREIGGYRWRVRPINVSTAPLVNEPPLHVLMAQRLRAVGISTSSEARSLSIATRDRILGGVPRRFAGAVLPTWGGDEDAAFDTACDLLDKGPIPIVERSDVQLREWPPNRDEGDVGVMYVLDVLGLNIIVRERDDSIYVHVDGDSVTEATRPGLAIAVEVNNGGEAIHGRS